MFPNVPLDEIRAQVLDFMRWLGCYPSDENLLLDGKLHRYHIEGDKRNTKNGAYCIYNDGCPAGFVQSWKGEKSTWKFNADKANIPQKVRDWWNSPEYKKEAEEKQKQRDKELKEQQVKASENAKIQFQSYVASTEIQHPYLTKKNIKAYGARFYLQEKKIAVPLFNINGNIQSLQWIDAEGNKLFFPGAPTSGAFFSIGLASIAQNDPILICEGFATGAKIHQLTGLPTVCAMTSNNISNVAKAIKAKFARHKIFIMADDDRETAKKRGVNPGVSAGQDAVNSNLASAFIVPPFDNPEQGSDWDDYALFFGDKKAREVLIQNIKYHCLSNEEKKIFTQKNELSSLLNTLDPTIQLPPQEFIGGLFPRGFLSAVVAPSGTGKTIFMQKVVSDLSIGGTFFDGFAEDEPPRKCLIFAGEAGYDLLVRRGASLKWKINPENVIVVDQYKFESSGKSVMLDDADGWQNIKMIIDMVKPDIVFFDTLMSFHGKDENKASEMKPVIKNLSDIAREKNIAVVLNHHSRKRTAKERTLSLNQDDVIGSSIFNRLVALIIGIEPYKQDELNDVAEKDKNALLVKTLKTWFRVFSPFTYKISENNDGVLFETDLMPEGLKMSKIAVWNYLQATFYPSDWFTISQIVLSEIEGDLTQRQLRRIISELVKNKKLEKRGETKNSEYRVIGIYG